MKNIVYILQSKSTGKYYTGITTDLSRRLKQHKSGQTHTTKRMGELDLVFFQEVDNLKLALEVEKRIKSWKRKDFIDKIVRDGKINFLESLGH